MQNTRHFGRSEAMDGQLKNDIFIILYIREKYQILDFGLSDIPKTRR